MFLNNPNTIAVAILLHGADINGYTAKNSEEQMSQEILNKYENAAVLIFAINEWVEIDDD